MVKNKIAVIIVPNNIRQSKEVYFYVYVVIQMYL